LSHRTGDPFQFVLDKSSPAFFPSQVDESFASVIKSEVSDGIIAPSYTPGALEILRAKKGGKFIVLAAAADAVIADDEWRVVHGCVLSQKRNTTVFTRAHLSTVVTASKELPDSAARDLIVASTAIKYTQSNSVAFAVNGQAIGIGAGQQSRVDCVKLAARKLATWFMRQHPSISGIRFKAGVKRQDKVNARVRIIEGNLTPEEEKEICEKIDGELPAPLSEDARAEFMKTLPPISLSSDAFFPYVIRCTNCILSSSIKDCLVHVSFFKAFPCRRFFLCFHRSQSLFQLPRLHSRGFTVMPHEPPPPSLRHSPASGLESSILCTPEAPLGMPL
jgi:hypothetical protein